MGDADGLLQFGGRRGFDARSRLSSVDLRSVFGASTYCSLGSVYQEACGG